MLASSFLNESEEMRGHFDDFFAAVFLRGDIYIYIQANKINTNMVTNLIRYKLVHKNEQIVLKYKKDK